MSGGSLLQVRIADRHFRQLTLGLIAVLALAAIAGGVRYGCQRVEMTRQEQCGQALHEISQALEQYCSVCNYQKQCLFFPDSLQDLVAEGSLVLPKNPYTGQPVPLLEPSAPPQPGGVVYIASTENLTLSYSVTATANTVRVHKRYCLLIYQSESNGTDFAEEIAAHVIRLLTWESASGGSDEQLIAGLEAVAWEYVAGYMSGGL
ncbi:hypothetical protein JW859_07180 [bacterium]|nr:hypothetical protein [bacterium]